MAKKPGSLTFLQVSSGLLSLAAVLQTGLGVMVAFVGTNVWAEHRWTGYTLGALAVVAAIAAVLWKGTSGNKGLMMHALGTAVLALVQIALGEIGGLRWTHIILGFLVFGSALAQASLAFSKPYAADRTAA